MAPPDPILGPRLVEWAGLVNRIAGRTALEIFGMPDDMKFHSSTTLFALADRQETAFRQALDKYCGGRGDRLTPELLQQPIASPKT